MKEEQKKKLRKAVVDTSVIISSVLGDPKAAPAKVLKAMYAKKFKAYSSEEAMNELYDVLFSEKVTKLLKGGSEVLILTYLFVNSSVILVNPRTRVALCRDPKDNKFLEIAYEAKADCIVTLDKDLLDMRDENKEVKILEYKIKILRPEEFLQEL
ncbi:putative toxin-antitoxin system toxin component, PIN family [Thermococcus aggregans]|uniref:Toxin-antitoxin system toxin component, PIN family n=1 Tax=Thermococcus aggregans TaxID=110163 RepID=A0A9E7SP10_THEAG|nr:putative toxin-antitoxin system toxin component, PIN family [Thermococcus aggregans]USS41018.1 putative toxin-antitoxin system toxin component, PIN family [Thermococcus aggregans]